MATISSVRTRMSKKRIEDNLATMRQTLKDNIANLNEMIEDKIIAFDWKAYLIDFKAEYERFLRRNDRFMIEHFGKKEK